MSDKTVATVEKYKKILTAKNYSTRTIEIYSHYLKIFINDIDKKPYHIPQKVAIEYLISRSYSSISVQNQFISSIKLFYRYVIGSKLKSFNIERPRKERKLPRVIDTKELIEKINSVENIKHRCILALGFGCGLRVSEVINLTVDCIDSKRMLILIKNAKGRKDRYVPFSETLLFWLRDYVKEYNVNDGLLFRGPNGKYSPTSCNNIVKRFVNRGAHFHLLRHSCFTSMLEQGTDLRMIQKCAGHKNVTTTEIYTHVSTALLAKVATPI